MKLIFDYKFSNDSHGVERMYSVFNELTVFFPNNYFGSLTSNFIMGSAFGNCVNNARYGYREDVEHASWHESTADYEIVHMHIFKANYVTFNSKELACALKYLHDFELTGHDITHCNKMKIYYKEKIQAENVVFECPAEMTSWKLLTKEDMQATLSAYEKAMQAFAQQTACGVSEWTALLDETNGQCEVTTLTENVDQQPAALRAISEEAFCKVTSLASTHEKSVSNSVSEMVIAGVSMLSLYSLFRCVKKPAHEMPAYLTSYDPEPEMGAPKKLSYF